MKTMPLVAVLLLLAACQRPCTVDALAADPVRLQALREVCRDHGEEARCRRVAQADLQRFLSGKTGADEYRTLAELPAIPPSFDQPMAEDAR